MEINSNHSTYGAAFAKTNFFMSVGKQWHILRKALKKYDTSRGYLYTWQQ